MHLMALQSFYNVSYEGNTRLRMKDWGILFPSLSRIPSEVGVKLVHLWPQFPRLYKKLLLHKIPPELEICQIPWNTAVI